MSERVFTISQGLAKKTVQKLRNLNYNATPVNASGSENSWDIEKIWVTKDGRELCDINCETGTISYRNSFDRDEINDILGLIQNIKEQEDIFMKAPHFKMEGVNRYKLLSQYKNVVFAACEISTLDYTNHRVNQFDYVTWELDIGGKGVHAGNYFGDNYAAAKEDFAKRSGLIDGNKLFSETEMLAIYAGVVKLQNIGEISYEQDKVINRIKDKISRVIPEVESKIYQNNPRYDESKELIDEVSEDDEQEI